MDRRINAEKHEEFRKELTALINKYGMENACDTPDFILADMMLAFYDAYALHVTRRDNWFGFDPFGQNVDSEEPTEQAKEAPEPEPVEDETSERGFVVVRLRKRNVDRAVFCEWRGGIPVLSDQLEAGMRFKYRSKAEEIAARLGDDWRVINVDEAVRGYKAHERLLKAIYGELDEPEDDTPDRKPRPDEIIIRAGSRIKVTGIKVEKRKDDE